MHSHNKTDKQQVFGGFQNSGITGLIHQDLERIEDIHQIKLSLVSLTRKISTSDTNRQMALLEVIHALSRLETAQDLIRNAQTN